MPIVDLIAALLAVVAADVTFFGPSTKFFVPDNSARVCKTFTPADIDR